MNRNKVNVRIKPWMGIFGFLGFFGFVSFVGNLESGAFMFMFFSFFSWYWEGKLNNEIQDERLLINRERARKRTSGILPIVILLSVMISKSVWSMPNYSDKAYHILLMGISFGYSLNNILCTYLTYKYDREGAKSAQDYN